jgi:hypothetical protein
MLKTSGSKVLLLTFVIYSLILTHSHEPWRDEAQAWLLAKDSETPYDILKYTGYEGSPGLWHLLLWPFARLDFPYETLKFINLFIISAAAYIFIKFSPFQYWQKALCLFGYFIAYEYNAVARSYTLSLLLLFTLAALYSKRHELKLHYLFTLAALANTNIHSLIIICPLALHYLIEGRKLSSSIMSSSAIIVCALILAVVQLLPPSDISPELVGFQTDPSIAANRLINSFGAAFVPAQKHMISFWDHLLFKIPPYQNIIPVLIVSCLVFVVLIKKRKSLLLYTLSSGLLLLFFMFKNQGFLRHHGFLYITFIFYLWISYEKRSFQGLKRHNIILSILLVIQAISLINPLYYELNHPFSTGVYVADYLKDNSLIKESTFISSNSIAATSAHAYIVEDYPMVYYLPRGEWGSHAVNSVHWSTNKLENHEKIYDQILASSEGYTERLLISPKTIEDERFEVLYQPPETIANSESLFLYRIRM